MGSGIDRSVEFDRKYGAVGGLVARYAFGAGILAVTVLPVALLVALKLGPWYVLGLGAWVVVATAFGATVVAWVEGAP